MAWYRQGDDLTGLPKTLRPLLDDPRVDEISNEASYGDGYWVYLTPGWIAPSTEAHCVHEWTVRETLEAFREVTPCSCEQCQGEG